MTMSPLLRSALFSVVGGLVLLGASFPALAQAIPSGSPLGLPSAAPEDEDEDGQDSSNESDVQSPVATIFPATNLGPADGSAERPLAERQRQQDNLLSRDQAVEPALPGEFEQFVARLAGREVPRYGRDLLLPASRDFAAPATATVPPDYVLNVGDVVSLYLTGSVQGTVEREIDTNGNIFLPSVGTVHLAGVRYADLREVVINAIGREYRFFNVGVGIKSLRGIRVYVTGFANQPGAFSLNSLSTLANAVFQAGGPAAGGSFRSIKLYRNGREVADFDLYSLLRNGQRMEDAVLQNEDVLFIGPAGEQVAVLGSVQQEAIFELKPGETLADALELAGGFNDLADPDRLVIYRTGDENQVGPEQVERPQFAATEARGGDILQILSRGSLIQPVARQSVLVRLEGEVNRPGNYFVAPNTSLQEILDMAGGPTERAFIYGARLERDSVRLQQAASYREAIEQLEFTLTTAPLTNSVTSGNADRRAVEMASARQALDLLRQREPDGRVVLDVAWGAAVLPDGLLVENQDHLVIPPRPTTVGVFGAVYRPGSFQIGATGMRLRDYISRAGGTHRAGDERRAFVVRANGDVLTRASGMLNAMAQPGDVVFIPMQTGRTSIWDRVGQVTSVIFQLALAAAAVNALQ
jgi:polysaccharide export outer membrane protein